MWYTALAWQLRLHAALPFLARFFFWAADGSSVSGLEINQQLVFLAEVADSRGRWWHRLLAVLHPGKQPMATQEGHVHMDVWDCLSVTSQKQEGMILFITIHL